jgi:predicted nucleic acid-binding protein
MIIVADASPLNYLTQLQCVEIPEQLYGRVLVPQAVMQELRNEHAPVAVREWSSTLPSWAEVGHLAASQDNSLRDFGAGEREASLLAQQTRADLLLIDERRGEVEAKRRGISTTGTLGVLLAAGAMQFLDPKTTFQRLLMETNYRASAGIQRRFLERCKELTK